MKKFVILALAFASFIVSANTQASYTGDVSSYYNNLKSEWTFDLTDLGPSTHSYMVYPSRGLVTEKVICWNVRKMCYVASEALRAFNFDVDAFQKGQEKVTGKKVNFKALYERLRNK